MKAKITPKDACNGFGVLLKSDKDISNYLLLDFNIALQRVSLMNLPMDVDPFWQQSCVSILEPKTPGPEGPVVAQKVFNFDNDKEIDIKILVDNDIVEIFVDNKIAFTYRIYQKTDYEIGLIAEDSLVDYNDIEFFI